jgi:uncharacterized protein with ParB-like and HNH nuclease domain
MEYQHYSIRKILDAVVSGEIRIPAFQRGFVWEMDRVAYLLDSVYKGRRQKLSATPDLSSTVLPLCLIPNSALKSAPPFKSVMPKA